MTEAQPLELLSPRQLLLVRLGPESDMMDRPYPAATTPESLGPSKIHHGANTLGGGFEAQAVALFTHRPKAHRALEQPGRTLVTVLPDGGAVETANGVLGGHRTSFPRAYAAHPPRGHQLEQKTVGVSELEDLLAEAARRALVLDPLRQQPFEPEPQRSGWDRKRHRSHLAGAVAARPALGPGEEGENGAWRPSSSPK